MSALWTGWSADATTNSKTFTCFATGFAAEINYTIGGANDGVYWSRDSGSTWTKGVGISAAVTAVASNSVASFMCCTTATTIYYSTDQGTNWTSITHQPAGDTGYTSICCGGADYKGGSDQLLPTIRIVVGSSIASGSSKGNLWYYNGINDTPHIWSSTPQNVYVTALVCTDNAQPNTNYFVAALSDNGGSGTTPDNFGLATSTDGINWSFPASPSGGDGGQIQTWSSLAYDAGSNTFIACSRDNPHLTTGGQVYTSINNGGTWNLVTSGTDALEAPFSYVSIVTGTADAPNLYACVPSGGNAGLWHIFNYGPTSTWTKDSYSPASSKATAVVVDIGGSHVGQPLAIAVAGETAGVYKATFSAPPAPTAPTGMVPIWKWQGIPTFTPTGNNLGVNQIIVCSSGVNSNNLALIAGNNGIYVLDGKGNLLNYFSTNTNVVGVAMSLDGSKLYAIEQGNGGAGSAKLYVSKSGGTNWPTTPLNGTQWTTFAPATSQPQGAGAGVGFSAICCDANGQNVVVTTNAGTGSLYYCADPSVSSPTPVWTQGQVSSSPISGQGFTAIACTPESGLPTYVALSSDSGGQATGHIYTSINGTTWYVDATSFAVGDQGANQTWTSAFCIGRPRLFFITSSGYGNGAGVGKGQVYRIGDVTAGTWENRRFYNYPYQKYVLDAPTSNEYLCAPTNNPNGTFFFNGGPQNTVVYDSTAYIAPEQFESSAIALNQSGPNVGLPLYLGTSFNANNEFGLYIATYNFICFKTGSKILCLIDGKESYVPVETMRPGTLVKTARSGYKKVELIGSSKMYNPSHTLRGKDRLYVCTKANYPDVTEDLVITGCHSILVKSLTDKQRADVIDLAGRIFATDDHYRLMACLDDRAYPYTEEGVHTIWHFALENNDYYMNYGVYANGLLVETTSKRMMKELSGMELL